MRYFHFYEFRPYSCAHRHGQALSPTCVTATAAACVHVTHRCRPGVPSGFPTGTACSAPRSRGTGTFAPGLQNACTASPARSRRRLPLTRAAHPPRDPDASCGHASRTARSRTAPRSSVARGAVTPALIVRIRGLITPVPSAARHGPFGVRQAGHDSSLGTGGCSPIMSARVRHERFADPCAIKSQAASAPDPDGVVLDPKPLRTITSAS